MSGNATYQDLRLMGPTLRNFFVDIQIFKSPARHEITLRLSRAPTELKPDLVLTDVRMPGLESRATKIAKLPRECGCPVIVMLRAHAEGRGPASSTGAARLVDKATLYEALIPTTIEEVLAQRGPTR
jgi:CheY-like chemotaxis protein